MKWHSAARTEYGEAYDRYEREDDRVAERFLLAIEAAEDSISVTPSTFPPYLHGTHRLMLKDFPFSVIYIIRKQRPIIVAIAHQRRKPGYWRRRV